jgi:hypothetical protein
VPAEDERLTPETRRGLRYNKVTVNVKVYQVGYVIVIGRGSSEADGTDIHTQFSEFRI